MAACREVRTTGCRVLQWFTGNIGFHHVHHLSAKTRTTSWRSATRKPDCAAGTPAFDLVKLACMRYRLWDEEQKRLITFAQFRNYRRAA